MKKCIALLIPVALVAVSCASHHASHRSHQHTHGPGCGHIAVNHDGHVDYADDGHLHHPHGSHTDEHTIPVSATNPNQCTPGHGANEHAANHSHGANCGHVAIPHGDHTDYLVAGHLHHPDGNHCDDHGQLAVVK